MYKDVVLLITHNRPGTPLQPQWLTVHNTANDRPGANARMNRNWFDNPAARASAHYVIDAYECVQCVPEQEVAWAQGCREGNATSLSIEVCENQDHPWEQIYENAILKCAEILDRHQWNIDRLRTHHSWTGKNCPRKLLPIWDQFLADVGKELAKRKGSQVIILKRGDQSEEVKTLQTELKTLGYPLVVDGLFGDETQKAVKAFQSSQGLTPDGEVGPATQLALSQALREHSQTPSQKTLYRVQVGAFANSAAATQLRNELVAKGFAGAIVIPDPS